MKHIIIDSRWSFTEDPFPMFRCELVFGRNKRDRKFIPTKVPIDNLYTVRVWGEGWYRRQPTGKVIGEFQSMALAQQCAKEFNNSFGAFPIGVDQAGVFPLIENPVLPEGRFQVIKTREKGTIMIVPGEDKTPRLLLMTGVDDGFRGGSAVDTKHTTANVISECAAGAACEGRVDVAAIMSPGDVLVFRAYGRYWDRTTTWSWDGTSLTSKAMATEEAFAAEEEAAGEVL